MLLALKCCSKPMGTRSSTKQSDKLSLSHLAPQPTDIVLAQVAPVQQHTSLQRVVKALNEADDCALATARLAHQRNSLTCRHKVQQVVSTQSRRMAAPGPHKLAALRQHTPAKCTKLVKRLHVARADRGAATSSAADTHTTEAWSASPVCDVGGMFGYLQGC